MSRETKQRADTLSVLSDHEDCHPRLRPAVIGLDPEHHRVSQRLAGSAGGRRDDDGVQHAFRRLDPPQSRPNKGRMPRGDSDVGSRSWIGNDDTHRRAGSLALRCRPQKRPLRSTADELRELQAMHLRMILPSGPHE